MALDHHFKEETNRARVIAASLCLEMRALHTVQAGSCAGAARESGDRWVLPRSMEVQMWKQIVHAMMHGLLRCFWFVLSTTRGHHVFNQFSKTDIEKGEKIYRIQLIAYKL